MKKAICSVLALVIIFVSASVPVFAEQDMSKSTDNIIPGTVIASQNGVDIIYLGRQEVSPLGVVTQTRSFNFTFQARADASPQIEIATFYVTHTSFSDGRIWGFYDYGKYSHTVKTSPFRLFFWEATYNTATYLQSSFKYEWRGAIYPPSLIKFNLDSSTGSITLITN